MITKLDIENDEVELNNDLGLSLLWQRSWMGPPQRAMTETTVPVVSATVVGGRSELAGSEIHGA